VSDADVMQALRGTGRETSPLDAKGRRSTIGNGEKPVRRSTKQGWGLGRIDPVSSSVEGPVMWFGPGSEGSGQALSDLLDNKLGETG